MTLNIRYFVRVADSGAEASGPVRKFFRWDGVSLSDLRDFNSMYCTADDGQSFVDPGRGLVNDPKGRAFFWYNNGEVVGNYYDPGTWIEIAPYSPATGPKSYVGMDGVFMEVPGPR